MDNILSHLILAFSPESVVSNTDFRVLRKIKSTTQTKCAVSVKSIRPGRGSNPGSSVYETDALPLGHRAYHIESLFK